MTPPLSLVTRLQQAEEKLATITAAVQEMARFVINFDVDEARGHDGTGDMADETRDGRETAGLRYVEYCHALATVIRELGNPPMVTEAETFAAISREPSTTCTGGGCKRGTCSPKRPGPPQDVLQADGDVKELTCVFCGQACPGYAGLRQHSATCREHPLAQQRIIRENEICQLLAQAIGGFPRYDEDLQTFPDATAADGVCYGDPEVETLIEALSQKAGGQVTAVALPLAASPAVTTHGETWVTHDRVAIYIDGETDPLVANRCVIDTASPVGYRQCVTLQHVTGGLAEIRRFERVLAMGRLSNVTLRPVTSREGAIAVLQRAVRGDCAAVLAAGSQGVIPRVQLYVP